ncbi:NADH-dependent flavin oxidoreductase [Tardiphaga sp.]|uniref:NADH-dependent flavin oxidoreductase n=1 Tax=Tardiphaga sp. TaxID=1926292 RepID=UPI002623DD9F|nr:NADH-dependent flavin oxidoreductase [Tardiphaga sp.]MDB5616657.1 nerA [Tardiphaga sp.]
MHVTHQKLFNAFAFANGISLRNRIVMAPMTTWAGNTDGTVSDEELAYYRARSNGVGLVITGCSHVTANGIGFTGEFASHSDRFIPGLRRLAEAAKSGGAPAILQIFHAGNKAAPALVTGSDVVSASAVAVPAGPFNPALTPRALIDDEIRAVITAFGEATRRAIKAGFDGVELHGAHGFLIQNFFSPHFNQRTDLWGGPPEKRMRFPLAVVAEVQRIAAAHAKQPFVIGYRISPEEGDEGGLRIEDTFALTDRLIQSGIGYLHFSLTSILTSKPIGATDEVTTAQRMVGHVAGRLPVLAAGQIRTPDQAVKALDLGLSLVAVGQGLVMNPDWVERAKAGRDVDTALWPAKARQIAIPEKLWTIIEATKGWFDLKTDAALEKPERVDA